MTGIVYPSRSNIRLLMLFHLHGRSMLYTLSIYRYNKSMVLVITGQGVLVFQLLQLTIISHSVALNRLGRNSAIEKNFPLLITVIQLEALSTNLG